MSKKDFKTNLTYLHKVHTAELKAGKMVKVEEELRDGPRGVSFKLFKKTGDKTEKYVAKQKEDGTFELYIVVGDKKDSQTLSKADLIKEIKKIKGLEFAIKYLASAKAVARQRARSSARTRSRKTSRKRTSRKTSKKRASRKTSKKRTSRKRKSRK